MSDKAPCVIGRIDYLDYHGQTVESVEYDDETLFRDDVKSRLWYGTPISVVIYTDEDGNNLIDPSWLYDLDTPPVGYFKEKGAKDDE